MSSPTRTVGKAVAPRVGMSASVQARRGNWRATGVWGTFNCFLTADGDGYAFTHGQVLNDLYVLDGLQF